MRFGVVQFPGSNCDQDCIHVVKHVLGHEAFYLWHKDRSLNDAECIILPGGFSYGDYLRCGAIARFSPMMEEVSRFARQGRPVLGICNGFQILTEAGLLPGALLQNAPRKFVCQDALLVVENAASPFTRAYGKGDKLRIPVAHGDGNYFLDPEGLARLEGEGRVAFRYQEGFNGSVNDIAGIVNDA